MYSLTGRGEKEGGWEEVRVQTIPESTQPDKGSSEGLLSEPPQFWPVLPGLGRLHKLQQPPPLGT